MPIRFGTDGWRAIVGDQFTYENVAKVIQAFCDVNQDASPKRVVLGHDRRFCSRQFTEEATQVLLGNGFEVILAKQFCPTPCVSWMTKEKSALAGVMITASHNPYAWNGIKFKESYGGSASPEYTSVIERKIEENEKNQKVPNKISLVEGETRGLLKYFDPGQEYLKHLKKLVDISLIRRAKLKIVVDPIYGAGSGFFSKILGFPVFEIRGEENPGFGGVNPEPIEKNLKPAFDAVRKHKAHIGLATDGDADRIGAIDEKGNFVDSQQIFSLLLRHLVIVKKWEGDIVKSVASTQMIPRLAEKFQRKVVEVPIGFKYICQAFRNMTPLIGGEESGGIGIAKHIYERDGVLAGLLLLEILAYHRKPLSKIIQDLQKEVGPLFYRREDLHLPLEHIAKVKAGLAGGKAPNFGKLKLHHTDFQDGFKFCFADESWLLIRPSGTEPLLRIYAEAPTVSKVRQVLRMGREFVENS